MNPRPPIFMARVRSESHDYDSLVDPLASTQALRSETASMPLDDYDDWGNLLASSTVQQGGGVLLETASTFVYDNHVAPWKLGRLTSSTVSTTRTTAGLADTNTTARASPTTLMACWIRKRSRRWSIHDDAARTWASGAV